MSKQSSKELPPVKQLALFVRKAKKLQRLPCFEHLSKYKSSITISGGPSSGIQISNLNKPPEDSYRSYLIDFRQFLLTESPVFANRILKMAATRARHIALREQLSGLKDELKEINKYLKGIEQNTENSKREISGYDLFLAWLNGTIFHHDVDSEELFSSLESLMDLTEVNFAKYVGLYSNFIVHLSAVIESGLNTNGFDLLNKFTPHTHPNAVYEIISEVEKDAVIQFWKLTKPIPQNLAVCDEHDQDSVIVVDNFDESALNLQDVKVELRGCCSDAIYKAINTINNTLAWIEYLEKHGQPPQSEPIQILELPITDPDTIQTIKTALDDYRLIWRRKVGKMRCSVHRMPPGARGFGVDIFHQGDGKETNSVFLQGCCLSFIKQVLDTLKSSF